ncbi:TIGR04282 family arsenosugar biosynthesis glycosyltransferase [Aestuariirhabdus sp. LZHN29]|uniref:TIGR04282 family arsenosugar biosynthesis glycosyltransferase n=1 Tax=Aestuariirhabdus sp. LZHN29 TaxID=3417462 RepID=UPI003CF714F3
MSSTRALLLFAKPPVRGQVKTRLISQLGAGVATDIHRRLLSDTAMTLTRCSGVQLQLWMGFDEGHSAFSAPVFSGWSRHLQVDGGLGERMEAAIACALKSYETVVVVGSDCPVLTPAYIESAFIALEQQAPVVFGPAEDGGYVLLGLRENTPALFRNIDWGSERVMQQSRERLQALAMPWVELDTLWDVDRPQDVMRWKRDLSL